MLSNKEISKQLKLIGQLLELKGENKFKTRSYANASFQVGRFPEQLAQLDEVDLADVPGMGKSTLPKVQEMIAAGESSYIQELIQDIPFGVVEMLSIKGIGPSKIRLIWQELGIESIGELLYACNENRLVDVKGFGQKTQATIQQNIQFRNANKGKFLYAQIEPLANQILEQVKTKVGHDLVSFTGEFRRKCQIIETLDILIGSSEPFEISEDLGVKINLIFCDEYEFPFQLFVTTATTDHVAEIDLENFEGVESEEEIYEENGFPFIIPEMREGLHEFEWCEENESEEIIQYSDLKGALHNHSVWSDGANSIEQMAQFCIEQNWQYLGMCDHSKTAVYANGLNEERVYQQQQEINQLNEKYSDFKILKGIESDILYNGDLDYSEDILKTFDFVVASVHSQLKMDEQTATNRLIKAIENPYTTILGHPTGRLLLSREGYPIDHEKVIDACAQNNVILELNANPFRLDIDYKWIDYAVNKGVMISINPDAHNLNGLLDMKYGVNVARKAGLKTDMVFNALDLEELLKLI
jgi:DNA polymerase (family 10)